MIVSNYFSDIAGEEWRGREMSCGNNSLTSLEILSHWRGTCGLNRIWDISSEVSLKLLTHKQLEHFFFSPAVKILFDRDIAGVSGEMCNQKLRQKSSKRHFLSLLLRNKHSFRDPRIISSKNFRWDINGSKRKKMEERKDSTERISLYSKSVGRGSNSDNGSFVGLSAPPSNKSVSLICLHWFPDMSAFTFD